MSIYERLLDGLGNFFWWAVTAIIGAVAGGVGWLIRQVFTNQKALEKLGQEIAHRDQLRSEDRERMTKVEAGIERIEGYLMGPPK